MPSLTINQTEFYAAPKNAGTTVRMWAKQFETGLSANEFETGGYYTLERLGLPRIWNDVSSSAALRFFHPTETRNLKWCIKRDPIDRFISGYTDKVLRERLANWTADETINLLESGEMERIAARKQSNWVAAIHLVPQCVWLGTHPGYYHRVFDVSEMDLVREFCEEQVFKMPLGRLHARNLSRSGVQKISLTPGQRQRLQKIFEQDYRAGWC